MPLYKVRKREWLSNLGLPLVVCYRHFYYLIITPTLKSLMSPYLMWSKSRVGIVESDAPEFVSSVVGCEMHQLANPSKGSLLLVSCVSLPNAQHQSAKVWVRFWPNQSLFTNAEHEDPNESYRFNILIDSSNNQRARWRRTLLQLALSFRRWILFTLLTGIKLITLSLNGNLLDVASWTYALRWCAARNLMGELKEAE